MDKKTDMEKLTLKAGRFIPMPGGEQLAGRVSRAEAYLTAMSGELEDLLDRISLLLRRTENRIAREEDRIARLEDSLSALQTMANTPAEPSASDDASTSDDVVREGEVRV